VGYIRSIWNYFDWLHYSLMIAAWTLWLRQVRMGSSLSMPTRFRVLASPTEQTVARMFRTDAEAEFEFLEFVAQLRDMAQNLAMYNFITSISGEGRDGPI
jgi:hypothetical protein